MRGRRVASSLFGLEIRGDSFLAKRKLPPKQSVISAAVLGALCVLRF